MLVVSLAVVLAVAVGAFAISQRGSAGPRREPLPTGTATIERRSLTVRETVDGALGYGARAAVAAPVSGVVSWLPPEGAIARRGARLLEVDGRTAVVLLYGRRPAWRTLQEGVEDGPDVLQLERNLVALGLTRQLEIAPDRHFDIATRAAVERLQRRLGLAPTGALPPGLMHFAPGARRIAGHAVAPGTSVETGTKALEVASGRLAATVELDADLQRYVRRGDHVSVLLPDGSRSRGVVRSVARVATRNEQGNASVAVRVDIPADRARQGLDEAPVSVEIARETARGALVVPVAALVVRDDGTFALEVVGRDGGRRLVAARPGLFASGEVVVSGPGLRPGLTVTVPA